MNGLPDGWTLTTIGAVCDQAEQRTPDEEETFTYIDIASIDRTLKAVTEPQQLLGANAPSRARKVVNRGDVIVSMTRPNLNAVALIDQRLDGCIASTGFDVLKPVEVEPRWIFYNVRAARFIQDMCDKVQGALYPAVKAADIRAFTLPLPPLAEQARIVQKTEELLRQVDRVKARIDAIPAFLNRFRQSVLAAAVSGRLTNGTEFPDGWTSVNFASVIRDLRYGTAQKCDYDAGPVGVLRIPNIGDNGISLSDLKSSRFSPAEIDKLAVKNGDILLIRSNGSVDLVGKSVVVTAKEEGLLFAGYLIRVRLDTESVCPGYVNYWLKSPGVRQAIEQTARSTSGVNNINSEEVKSLKLNLPPRAEQTRIVERIQQLFAFADQLEAKVASAKVRIDHLTQSILAKAFRGELVPQAPGDEPASVLLERIQARKAAAPKARRSRKASA